MISIKPSLARIGRRASVGSATSAYSATSEHKVRLRSQNSKSEKDKKSEYYKAHKSMHSMYADSAVKDIYDVISDDTIDLNRFACMCDSFGLFYSEDSTAAVLSSKISENQDLPNKHNHTQTLPHIDLCHHNTLPSKVGTRCGVDCALDAGGTLPEVF